MQQRSLFSGEEPESPPIADALARHGWRITGQRVGMDGEVEFRITGRAQRGTSTIWRREALWKTRAGLCAVAADLERRR